MGRLNAAIAQIIVRISPRLLARIELLNGSRSHRRWNGPCNGQPGRQAIVRSLLATVPPDLILETGSYRGATSEWLATLSTAPVHTVECVPLFHHYTRMRLRHIHHLHAHLGDSRAIIERLASQSADRSGLIFAYLDAHWEDDLPLAEEIALIAEHWSRAVIVIDDFRVLDDPDYGYDDYGIGKVLEPALIADVVPADWRCFVPRLPGRDEPRPRRGCIVLADSVSAAACDDIASLRPAP